MGVGGQYHDPATLTPGMPGGWAPGPFWTGAENLAPHRVSIPRSFQPVATDYHGLREQHSSFVNVNGCCTRSLHLAEMRNGIKSGVVLHVEQSNLRL
jgi:hypothetical protein